MISVIVPVYKVERFLPKCIESILAQRNGNFELLLIDDGSPDNSGKICDEYAAKDPRIKVFHTPNGGVSAARNVGLDNATGDWLSFVDSDDWVDPQYLDLPEELLTSDVIQKPYNIYLEDDTLAVVADIKSSYTLNSFEQIAHFFVKYRSNALWDKLISRRVVADRRFDTSLSVGEDFLFFLSCLSDIKSYSFSTRGAYNYLRRQGSVMSEVSSSERKLVENAICNIDFIRAMPCVDKLHSLYNSIIYFTYVDILFKNVAAMQSAELMEFKEMMRSIEWRSLKYMPLKSRLKLFVKRLILLVVRR